MRYAVLAILLLISLPAWAQVPAATPVSADHRGVLVRAVVMEGFALADKKQFVQLFKPYRDKHLTFADMDELKAKIQDIYDKEGYQQLVAITYRMDRDRLVFTALMTS